ncbi:hypothetical protein AAVH_18073 [Aphelenchoides avenae]|nr:hypothetical protein AAVH_18073 [Aphelenchus avenae]
MLKGVVDGIVSDCKWYRGEIRLHFLTKNHSFVEIHNPLTFDAIDTRIHEFMYSPAEREHAYEAAVKAAYGGMTPARSDDGRYILVFTNFERIHTGGDENSLVYLDRLLEKKGIQLRHVRLQFGDYKGTIVDPTHIVNVQRVTNVSNNIVRVSLVEVDNVMSTIKPCPPLTPVERIQRYQFIKQYSFQFWIDDHYREFIIGLIILISAVLLALASYLLHVGSAIRAKFKKSDEHPIIPA